MSFLARRLSAAGRLNPLSSNLAIATATAFVLMSAALSVAIDRDTHVDDKFDAKALRTSWSLRGTIPPTDLPFRSAPKQAETVKPLVLG